MRDIHRSVLPLVAALTAMATLALSANGASAAINYNASKSNTGNFTARRAPRCGPGVVKSCLGPGRRVDVKQIDPNHGQPIGRRRHTAIIIRKEIDRPTP
jgi:hypothetical protein